LDETMKNNITWQKTIFKAMNPEETVL
jgi:hypothetical protein